MFAGPAVSIEEREFCNELIRLTGHEHSVRDVRAGLSRVFDYGDISLSEVANAALASLLDELQIARRFRGEPTFAEGVGEESATHSLHVNRLLVAVANRVLEREGSYMNHESRIELERFKEKGVIAGSNHDIGEILIGEFSTVRERTQNQSAHTEESSAELERCIFVRSASLALHCAENAGDFGEAMHAIRASLPKVPENIADITLERLELEFGKHSGSQPESLSKHAQSTLREWVELYDATESTEGVEHTQENRFIGCCVKVLERLQGQHHYLRFSKKSPDQVDFSVDGIIQTPWNASQDSAAEQIGNLDSALVIAGIKRAEGKLGELFELAQTDIQKAITREIRDKVYFSILESFDTLPPLITVPGDAAKSGDGTKTAEQLLSGKVLQARYLKALETGHEPSSGQILALLTDLPEELSQPEQRDLDLSRRGIDEVSKKG